MLNLTSTELAQQLISYPSVTPHDCGCQKMITTHLRSAGFSVENLKHVDIENILAVHGRNSPSLIMLGHTDVVPPGDASKWDSKPFTPCIRDSYLYGRGATDMKAALAAMLIAGIKFVHNYPEHKGALGFIITGDEEAEATNGTVKIIETLKQRNYPLDYCLIGEPSSSIQVADTIKHGRRGSINATLNIIGKQGHIAYPSLALNPIHLANKILHQILAIQWDTGNQDFEATSLQVSNIHGGSGVTNVIPATATITFNLRFSPITSVDTIKSTITTLLNKNKIKYDLKWNLSALPFISPRGELITASFTAIEKVLGYTPKLSTGGGTSDGRFVASTGAQIIEIGSLNATAHHINERIKITDIQHLEDIYYNILINLLT